MKEYNLNDKKQSLQESFAAKAVSYTHLGQPKTMAALIGTLELPGYPKGSDGV